ncbi:MAG: ABC transporter ATP-binding protein [Bacillota bacterium]
MTLLSICNLQVHFPLPEGTVRALDGVDLSLGEKERLAIIGETGSGKTVLGRAVVRLLPPGAHVRGEIWYEKTDLLTLPPGEMRKIRGREIAIVLQNPANSLNPVIKVGKQIMEAVQARRDIARRPAYREAVNFLQKVGLPDRAVSSYPHQLSGGMSQRALLALGLAMQPRLLIADEPTKGLDSPLRAQIVRLLQEATKESGRALFLITHDLAAALELADTLAVMYAGQIVEYGRAKDIFTHARHPYTRGLLASHPGLGLKPIPGFAPSLTHLPPGCRFHPRCAAARELCRREVPPLSKINPGHKVRCHYCSA